MNLSQHLKTEADVVGIMQETSSAVRRRPLSGPPERKYPTAEFGGFRGVASERAPSIVISHPKKTPLDGSILRQQSAATPLDASRKTAPGSASSRAHVTPRTSEGVCCASLPPGVERVVAGSACSLLLRTNPPCCGKLNWDVSLVSYSHDSHPSAACSPQHGLPVAFVLGTSSGGVQSCSFIATQAGEMVCRARVRGRAMESCLLSVEVVACEASAAASRVYLVHPLPSTDVVLVDQDVSLRLMVRAFAAPAAHAATLSLTASTGQHPRRVRQPLHHAVNPSHTLQACL